MNDLGQRLREYYDAAGPPLDIESIVAQTAQSATRRQRVRVVSAMSAAAAAMVLLLIAYILIVPGRARQPVIDEAPTVEPEPSPSAGNAAADLVFDPDATEIANDIVPFPGAPILPGAGPPAGPSPGPSTSEAPRTAPAGQLLYEDSDDEIRILDVATGTSRRIAHGEEPRWSPDGRSVSYRDGDVLWTVRADGTQPTQVSEAQIDFDGAPFSPDSSRLAYAASLDECGPETSLVPPFGCAPQEEAGVWIVGVDGSNPRRIATGAAVNPAWNPDGTRVAYARNGAIWTVGATGGAEQLVHQPAAGTFAHRPQYSPDGTRLAFYVQEGSGQSLDPGDSCGPRMQLWTVNSDGSQPRSLGSGPYWSGVAGVAYVRAPQWSPDGRAITFGDETAIWFADASTGTTRSVLPTQGGGECGESSAPASPTWSPDGQFIVAYSQVPDGASVGLIAITPDASEFHYLVPGVSRAPTWRPSS